MSYIEGEVLVPCVQR